MQWLSTEISKEQFDGNIYMHTSAAGGLVMDVRHLASLDAANVLHEQIVVALHFLRRLPADGPGDIVPAVGGFLVVHREGPLERLVLLRGPTRCHLREWGGSGDSV